MSISMRESADLVDVTAQTRQWFAEKQYGLTERFINSRTLSHADRTHVQW